MSALEIFDETKAKAWQLVATLALVLAVLALGVSSELSLCNLGVSLIAGLVAFLISLNLTRRFPTGILSLCVLILAGLWLSPLSSLSIESKRFVFAAGVLYLSLVFQGPVAVYFAAVLLTFGVCLHDLSGPGSVGAFSSLIRSDSYLAILAGLVLGTSTLFARLSRTRSADFLNGLKAAVAQTEKSRERILLMQDGVQVARDRILGRTLTSGESLLGELPATREAIEEEKIAAPFDLLISELRAAFSDYQVKGRADGRISGPIRFVFFAPVAGYDEKAIIGVDLPALRSGLDACLTLALESLPEIGARKREGVIRLSIRYGLRVVEVAVEDNGRGLATRNPQAEQDLGELKDLVVNWGGKFDRLARLGVGSRTSLELRILSERTRAFSSGRLQAANVPRA